MFKYTEAHRFPRRWWFRLDRGDVDVWLKTIQTILLLAILVVLVVK